MQEVQGLQKGLQEKKSPTCVNFVTLHRKVLSVKLSV